MDVDEGKATSAGQTATYHEAEVLLLFRRVQEEVRGQPRGLRLRAAPAAPRDAGPQMSPVGRLKPLDVPQLASVPGSDDTPVLWSRPPVPGMPGTLTPSEAAKLLERYQGRVVIDVACGTVVSKEEAEKAGWTSQYRGATQYFKSKECKQLFDSNPDRYFLPGDGAPGAPPKEPVAKDLEPIPIP